MPSNFSTCSPDGRETSYPRIHGGSMVGDGSRGDEPENADCGPPSGLKGGQDRVAFRPYPAAAIALYTHPVKPIEPSCSLAAGQSSGNGAVTSKTAQWEASGQFLSSSGLTLAQERELSW